MGTVVPADEIYWQTETEMLQSAILPRDVATVIRELNDDTEDGKLRSRLCALIFMIGKLERNAGPLATGVRATSDALADLVVDDLTTGSVPLRQRVPIVLQTLVDAGTLILFDSEYRLQTPESIEWEADYRGRFSRILGDAVRMAIERDTAMREGLATVLRGLTILQGETRTLRKYDMHLGLERPAANGSSVPLWIQDGWSVSLGSVCEEARQAGVDSSTVFVFLPRLEPDKLQQAIAQLRAAEETVKTRAVPQTSAGIEAKGAMQSRMEVAGQHVSDLVDNIIRNAQVYQGGGNEIIDESFPEVIRQAVEAALTRLFPKFPAADQRGWNEVVTRASQGAADSLLALGYASEVEKHPVCQEVRSLVGIAGKKGSGVRRCFSDPPYGWSRDAIDGALLAMLADGCLRARRGGQAVTAKGMTQQQIGVTDFFSEGVTVSVLQRIAVRKVASAMGLLTSSGEEAEVVPMILECLQSEAQDAGGDAPLPEPADTTIVRELQELAGNHQIVRVAELADVLIANHGEWLTAGEAARERLPEWHRLERLVYHARNLPVSAELAPQLEAIRCQRSLLTDPNPISPLLSKVTTTLRQAVFEAHGCLRKERDQEVNELEKSDDWMKLKPAEQARILESNGLDPIPDLSFGTDQALMDCLEDTGIQDWNHRLLALKTTDRSGEGGGRPPAGTESGHGPTNSGNLE